MPSPTDAPANQKPTPVSRRGGRAELLRTAQIYDVRQAEAMPTGDLCVAVLVGDEQCTPHVHGLRAPRTRWAEIFGRLAAEDAAFAALLRGVLAAT